MKNILLILTDQHRFDALGCMGHSVLQTPNIDKLARDGTLFSNAHCVSTLCVPSRISMFTGLYVHKHKSTSNRKLIKPEEHSLIEEFKKKGYSIGLAGKNHAFGDEYLDRSFDYVEQYDSLGKEKGHITESDKKVIQYRTTGEKRESFSDKTGPHERYLQEGLIEGPEPFPEEECITYRIAQDSINFIRQNKDRPFFLYSSFPDPHFPNVVCEPYNSMYDAGSLPELEGKEVDWSTHPFKHFVQSQSMGFSDYTEHERKKILASYYGQITFIDKAVGRIMQAIGSLGSEEDTIVIFTSDHGDFGGRYGLIGKTGGFYEVLVRIPLLIKIPEFSEARKIDANVSNIDLLPTILEYLDFDVPQNVQGCSFLDVLRTNKEEHREEIYAEVGEPELPPAPMTSEQFNKYRNKKWGEIGARWFIPFTTRGRSAMIKRGNWKYCYYVRDKEELYDLGRDPFEIQNLAYEESNHTIKEKLKTRLFDWLLTAPYAKNQ